jgi:hypothetical protein
MDFGIYGGSVEADGWGLHVRAELNGKKIALARLVGLAILQPQEVGRGTSQPGYTLFLYVVA